MRRALGVLFRALVRGYRSVAVRAIHAEEAIQRWLVDFKPIDGTRVAARWSPDSP
jgi:hypothetical protein